MGAFAELALILGLLLINAFLSASEIAIVSVRRSRIKQLADEGHSSAQILVALTEDPSAFLATIQVGITLAGFLASAVGAVSLADSLKRFLLPVFGTSSAGIALLVVTLSIAFLSIVFGELVPKRLAIAEAESIAMAVARPINFLARLVSPIIWLLTAITNSSLALLGSKERVRLPSITEDELRSLVESAADEGVVDRSEQEMIDDIFDFGETTVREVMAPRIDMIAIERNTSIRDAMPKFFKSGHGRLPIYEGNLDTIVGVLYSQDVLQFLYQGGSDTQPVSDLARAPLFVPEQKKVSELLKELRISRVQLAIVVDEYGGTAGLVTLEDIIEEIVGEIRSEHRLKAESSIEWVSENELVASARLSVDELNDLFDLDLEVSDVDTIGGLIFATLGRIPQVGEKVTLEEATFEVLSLEGKRIQRVRITKNLPGEGDRPQ